VAASPDAVWAALLRVVEASFSGGPTPRLAAVVGCQDRQAGGPRPLAAGSTVPGFHVAAAEPPRLLALVGGHRFSAYALTFRLDDLDLDGGGTRLRAETRAAFPGLAGTAYRGLVIGTRMHVLVVNRILAATRRAAERA
jgi:hypothetical protein